MISNTEVTQSRRINCTQKNLPACILALNLLQDVDACQIETEHKQICEGSCSIQAWIPVADKSTVPQPPR